MKRILVVEDDRTIRTGLRDALVGEGFDVTIAADGDEGMDLALARHFDLALLDVMLPGPSGLEILRAMRQAKVGTEVIVLTARGDELDRVLGLELGADDYVTKPFSVRELLARVKARARRIDERRGQGAGSVDAFKLGDVDVDLAGFRLTRDGASHALSPREVAMLALLWRERGKVVSRERFLSDVWGSEQFVGTRTVDTHMFNLRQKLERDPRAPRWLQTVHGVGYRLSSD
jgi:two-component system alkaline phosphatase synthesis response regulator PhoP